MKKLKDIAKITAGYPFRGAIKTVPNSLVIAIQMKDVSVENGINWPSCTRTVLLGKKIPTWLQANDILFTTRGMKNYAVHIDSSAANYQAVPSPHFFIIQSTSPDVSSDYLAWVLNQTACQRYFQRSSEGSLTKSIRREVLELCPIQIPPLTKQQQIMRIQTTIAKENTILTQLIDNNNKLMATIANKITTGRKL